MGSRSLLTALAAETLIPELEAEPDHRERLFQPFRNMGHRGLRR